MLLEVWGAVLSFLVLKMNTINTITFKLKAQSSHSKPSHFGTFREIYLVSPFQTAETLLSKVWAPGLPWLCQKYLMYWVAHNRFVFIS